MLYFPGEKCGSTSFTGSTGIVTSPRFPLSYPNGVDCVYSIDVDRTKAVSLDFLSFSVILLTDFIFDTVTVIVYDFSV